MGELLQDKRPFPSKREFKNELSWSYSRDRTFQKCLRMYYWHYYASWGGWEHEADERTKLAYRLKNMSNLKMWAGEIVHLAAERVFKAINSYQQVNVDQLKEWSRGMLNQQWVQSVEKKWMYHAKRNLNLSEHYFGQEVSREDCFALRDKVFACIDRMVESVPFVEVKQLGPKHIYSIEKLETFDTDGYPCYVKIDLAYFREDEQYMLVDWKTGQKNPGDREQMLNYALYIIQKEKVSPEQIRLMLVYLDEGDVDEWSPAAEDLMRYREVIFSSLGSMKNALDVVDENKASIENFPMTENRSLCDSCHFREMCYTKDGEII